MTTTKSPAANLPRIAITLGDPGGIGPEVVCKALSDQGLKSRARFRVFGPKSACDEFRETLDVILADDPTSPGDFPAAPTAAGGQVSFDMVEGAIAAAKLPPSDPLHADAIVTGPISKHAWKMAGHGEFPGHTELFAARFGGPAGMMFVSPRLRVILATTHIPLMKVRESLTPESLHRTIELGNRTCIRLGITRPRIAVCGLNPHAGEAGLLGDDEQRLIGPAILAAQRAGMDARGPFPGDTIFNAAVKGDYDLVVAMYHDQGLIPVKLLDRDRAVNVTVGLPVIRTSPDHGTAFDIAGRNIADPGSMIAAIDLAIRLATSK